MPVDNNFIADQLSLLSKVMDIHSENSFKSKSYSIAAFTIEKLPEELSEIPAAKLSSIKGIGDSVAKKVSELLATGGLKELNSLIEKTPPGVLEMLNIKGIGPKKIATIWKEMEIESIGELLYACNENRLSLYKGFGEKTQKNVQESIELYLSSQSSFLFAQIETFALAMQEKLQSSFKDFVMLLTGDFRRHALTIYKLECVTTAPLAVLQKFFEKNNYEIIDASEEEAIFKTHTENVLLHFYISDTQNVYRNLFETSCSEEFLNEWVKRFSFSTSTFYKSEEEIFKKAGVAFIEPYLREKDYIIHLAEKNKLPNVIDVKDINAIIHCHSKWSDGGSTIENLAKAAIDKGFEYLVLSDHSKSAYYANGLNEQRIIAQHEEIDELNKKLKPFKIFKSIESDILNDGNLDYAPNVLSTFDIIIASPHTNLKMDEEKAMKRLLKAIENPYTSILGHMTGRLLLSRKGLTVDHKKIIDACAANDVVIELNANPRRLDMDWHYLDYCLEKNVLISIDPDAHAIKEFDIIKYGVYAAQKGGVIKENNVSSFSLKEFEAFVSKQQKKTGR